MAYRAKLPVLVLVVVLFLVYYALTLDSQALGEGWLYGSLHTASGIDHWVSIAPLVLGAPAVNAAWKGSTWGLGHASGFGLLSIILLLIKDWKFPVLWKWPQLSGVASGLVLVVAGSLGILDLWQANSLKVSAGFRQSAFAAFAAGLVHGFSPDTWFICLKMNTYEFKEGLLFLVAYVFGTVSTMGLIGWGLSWGGLSLSARMPEFMRVSILLASGLSLVFGGFLVYTTVMSY